MNNKTFWIFVFIFLLSLSCVNAVGQSGLSPLSIRPERIQALAILNGNSNGLTNYTGAFVGSQIPGVSVANMDTNSIAYNNTAVPNIGNNFTAVFRINISTSFGATGNEGLYVLESVANNRNGFVYRSSRWQFRLRTTSNEFDQAIGQSLTLGQEYDIVLIWNGTHALSYVNGNLTNSTARAGTLIAGTDGFTLNGMFGVCGVQCFSHNMRDVAVYNTVWTQSEITAYSYGNVTTSTISANLTANYTQYFYDSRNVSVNIAVTNLGYEFNVRNICGNVTLENGSILPPDGLGGTFCVNNIFPATSNYNFTFNFSNLLPGRYFFGGSAFNSSVRLNVSFIQFYIYNITAGVITSPLNNSVINRYLIVNYTNSSTTNNSVGISNYLFYLVNSTGNITFLGTSTNGSSIPYDMYANNTPLGLYFVYVEVNDSRGNKINYTGVYFNHTADTHLNITAFNLTGSPILNFSLNVTELNTSRSFVVNTTTGSALIDAVRTFRYNVIIDAPNYAITEANITANNTLVTFYNFTLYDTNSLVVYAFNELNNLPLNVNATLSFLGVSNSFTRTLSGTTAVYTSIPADSYVITVTASNYSTRTYVLTMTNRSVQTLNLYFAGTNETVPIGIFTKSLSDNIIGGATLAFYVLENSSYVGVLQTVTDGTGYTSVNLVQGKTYRLIITADNFNIYQIDWVPYAINSPYTFKLTPSSNFVFTSVNDFVRFNYAPTSTELINGTTQSFNFTTFAINGSLIYTAINCSGTSSIVTGSPSGAFVTVSLPVSSNTVITCTYSFNSVETGVYAFNITYRTFLYNNASFVASAQRVKSVTSNIYLTLTAYIIIAIACLGIKRIWPDPRLIGGVICIGIIFFTVIGWVDPIMGGVTGMIGLLVLFMGSR